MQDHDIISDFVLDDGTAAYPGMTKKRWQKIGMMLGSVEHEFNFSFRFKHFFPFISESIKGEERYLFVDKIMTI